MSLIFVGIKNLNGITNLTKKLESLKTLTFGKVIDKKYLISLSKKIKESFDPKSLFNPGRMYREI